MPKKDTQQPANGDQRPALVIPKFEDYHLGKDPMDPYSRESFNPWRFEFTKNGAGGMKIYTHQAGADPQESTNGLEIIFLFEGRVTQCRAKHEPLKIQRFCFSPDREYATKGYKCKECPYADKNNPKNVGIKRPLFKTIYFLARHPKLTDGRFELVEYTTGLNNFDAFLALKSAVKSRIKADLGVNPPVAAASTVIIKHKLERPKADVVVGRFDTNFDLNITLTAEELTEVHKLVNELVQHVDTKLADANARNKQRFEENRDRGLLDPWAQPENTAAPAGGTAAPDHDDDIPGGAAADEEAIDFNPEKLEGLTAPETLPK